MTFSLHQQSTKQHCFWFSKVGEDKEATKPDTNMEEEGRKHSCSWSLSS